MEKKTAIGVLPYAWKVWKWMPGPLRVVLIVTATAIAVYRLVGDDDGEAASA